jgi:hypothetical protein
MVATDQIHFEPPGGVGGELWPFVVAHDFAFHVITFVSDHMPLGSLADPKAPLKSPSKAQKGCKRSKYALRFGTY